MSVNEERVLCYSTTNTLIPNITSNSYLEATTP